MWRKALFSFLRREVKYSLSTIAVLVEAQSNKSGRGQRNRRSLGSALRAILPLRRSVVLPKKLLCSRKAAMLRRLGQIQSTEPTRVTRAVVYRFNNKHLMTGPKETGNFVPQESQCFPWRSPGNVESGNSINLAVTAVVGHHSRGTCTVTLWRHRFCNVGRSEILAGNSFIVRFHETWK